MWQLKDKTGMVFGWLLVLERAPNRGRRVTMYLCQCLRPGCGHEVVVASDALVSGRTKSCGCLGRALAAQRVRARCTTHGLSSTRAYQVWNGMMSRCYDMNDQDYKNYGGRGITVCERWHTFENFLEDMGQPPPGLTLDRIKNWLGYSKENCHWATRKEQNRNRRSNRYMLVSGVQMTVAEVSEKTGIPASTIINRLNRGMSDHDAITKPVRRKLPYST